MTIGLPSIRGLGREREREREREARDSSTNVGTVSQIPN